MMNITKRRRNESGAALVEFAIAFPVLILLMMSILDFGMNYGNKVQVQNATRAAARAGSVSNFGPTATCTLNDYSSADPTSQRLACRAKSRTHMDDESTAVRIFYMGPSGKLTTNFDETAMTGNKFSLVVCMSAKTSSLSGLFRPLFKGKFHHSRSVTKTGKPSTGAFAPPGQENPLVVDGIADDWSWCQADDPNGTE